MYFSNLEKFENKLKGRLCIINIPKQIEDLNESSINSDCNSFKYLILLQKNGSTIDKFELKINENKKIPFYIDEKYELQLNNFYDIYKKNKSKLMENLEELAKKNFNLLFETEGDSIEKINNNNKDLSNNEEENEKNLIVDKENSQISDKTKISAINIDKILGKNKYIKYIELAFFKFDFKNCKTQFEQIKKLCLLYILKCKYYKCNKEISHDDTIHLLSNFEKIIKSSETLPYIDRIRIILAYTNNKLFDTEYKNKTYNTYLLNLYDDLKERCSYVREAYKILYQIIDNLNESSSFFVALHQLNSYIEYGQYSKNKMYSSSILTLNDVKLDFIKNNYGYFFINDIKSIKTYAYYCPFTKLIFYNPYAFISEEDNRNILELNKQTEKKATCVSLFLTFHEDCGHLKNGINNTEDTPRQFYDNDLVLKISGVPEINDSGYIFEYFLNNSIIKVKSIMSINKVYEINSLLDYKYYIDTDFIELQKILDDILPNKKKKMLLNGSKNKGDIEDDDDIDYEGMCVYELYDLLSRKPENISSEEYDKIIIKNKGYAQLKKYYNGRKKP